METTITKPLAPEKKLFQSAWLLVPVGYLWFRLIDNLRLEWTTNPQYSFGLVVPLLVAGLLLRRWHRAAALPLAPVARPAWRIFFWLALPVLFYLPTRLVEAATPEWRPIQWLLGIEAAGLTLAAVYFIAGKNWLKQMAFPVLFFFVAIPWPSLFETPIIQGLTHTNAALVVQVMSLAGVPAFQHGNLIEVSTGMVGINDACSGIRSLQSSIMLTFFFGEFYWLRWPRRLLLVPVGFLLAMTFNLCRTSLLAWIAANKGVAAVADYHDEAGFSILVACTLTIWLAAILLGWRHHQPDRAEAAVVSAPSATGSAWQPVRWMALLLVLWLVLVETGVAMWYRIRESHIKPGLVWSVKLPEDKPAFQKIPVTADENILLRFDDARQGRWPEADGTTWVVYYFDWRPGRVAGYLAKRHTPDICLPAAGLKMVAGPTLLPIQIHGVALPFRSYVFAGQGGQYQVYQCHWEPGENDLYANESSRFNLIRGVWAGRGNQGQKVLEIIIAGAADPEQARQELLRQLDGLIQVEK